MKQLVARDRHDDAGPGRRAPVDPRAPRIRAWIQAGTYPLHPQHLTPRQAARSVGHTRTVTGAAPGERCVVCAGMATVRYPHLDPLLTLCEGCLVLWGEVVRGGPALPPAVGPEMALAPMDDVAAAALDESQAAPEPRGPAGAVPASGRRS